MITTEQAFWIGIGFLTLYAIGTVLVIIRNKRK